MIAEKLKTHFEVVKTSSLFKDFYSDQSSATHVLPIAKDTLRKVLHSNFDLQKENKGVYLVRSGGSSAKPLIFPVDIQENLYQRELLANALVKYGMVTPTTIALNLFSYKDMYRSAGILDDILERCNATTISLSASSSFEIMYHTATEFKANLAMGTPTKIAQLATYVLKHKLTLKIDKIIYGGEFLLDSHARLFKKVFGTTQIYSLYGSAETGIWAWGNYGRGEICFELLDDIIVEIENADINGNGRVIVTNLLRKRFPVFRYLMGDIGRIENKDGKRILILTSRDTTSFSIDSEAYFLNEFNWLYDYVDRFQIQLSLHPPQQGAIQFLLISEKISEKKREEVKEKLDAIFKFDVMQVLLTIQFVDETELYMNPTSSKTPIIVDFRT
ncbi:phenylacetate--CoA ligase family protein [Tenacibaculum amylolyticum]|uniref:hypothetical protein n=1 Tax=Tenacibaculum amylolyticum TaxID=104269 RepID=UPI0038953FFF